MPFLPFFAKPDDLIREVAATVHADRPQGQFRAVFLFPCTGKELVQVCPHLTAFQVAVDALVPDAPAFSADTPAHHFGLEAVILGIDTSRQVHYAVRDFGLVELAAVQQVVCLHRFARFLPRQAQVGVHKDLHLLVIAALCVQVSSNEVLHDLVPPAEGGADLVHVEAPHRPFRVFCVPLSLQAVFLPAVFVVKAATLGTAVLHAAFRPLFLVEHHVVPNKGLIKAAVRARHRPFLLGGCVELVQNAAVIFVGGGRHQHRLVIPVGRLALLGQHDRVALFAGAGFVSVHLVRQQHLDGAAAKIGRGVCTNDGQLTSGKVLFHDRVARVAALVVHKAPEHRSVPDHGSQTVFAETLAQVHRRLHDHDRGRVVTHVVPDGVQDQAVRLAGLGAHHGYHLADMDIPDGIHNLPLERCIVRIPAALRCGCFRRQAAVVICPLTKGQVRGRLQRTQCPAEHLCSLRFQVDHCHCCRRLS